MNITTRKLSDIKLNSSYLRLDTDVSALKQSILSVGLIHPLAVNPDNELLAGARRFQALSELGWEQVPVQVIDQDALVQELISIDENLVRAPLTSLELEQSLNRGREIYEQLNPAANKVDLSLDEPTGEEKAFKKELEEQDKDSFAAVTAGKTGLSKAVIKSAIKRDELASEAVKKARGDGALDATKTNEIIKLDAALQAEVLPLITDKTSKEARRIVQAAREGGLEAARAEAETVVPMPREYRQMISPVKKVTRTLARILVEDLQYDGPEQDMIRDELLKLWDNLVLYFEREDGPEEAADAAPEAAPDDAPGRELGSAAEPLAQDLDAAEPGAADSGQDDEEGVASEGSAG